MKITVTIIWPGIKSNVTFVLFLKLLGKIKGYFDLVANMPAYAELEGGLTSIVSIT